MPKELERETRKRAQAALTKAQDEWLSTVELHGQDYHDPEVLRARQALDKARKNYLAVGRDNQ
jgi:hypothetical protein